MVAAEVASRLPPDSEAAMLIVKPLAPLLTILYHWRRGAYPELRGQRLSFSGAGQDVLVGLALTLVWIAPYVFFDGFRLTDPAIPNALPDFLRADTSDPFDPLMLGSGGVMVVLAARMFGYALVTPLFEELFIRSFVMRYAEVYSKRGDFRNVPLAHYTMRSFVVTTVVFTIGHVPWEWWVAIPWVALSNLWFYHRRNLWALILTHGVTNAALLLLAVFGGGLFRDGADQPISLWFFV
jgi:CAAX prenyl protease-like protein